MQPTPKELIAKLGLEPHQEGGWFRQAYKSATQVEAPQGQRSAITTIYYLLEHSRASPWHVVQSDEIWHFYHGAPSELFSYDPVARKLIRHRLNAVTGEGVQVAVIPAGHWQAVHCLGEYMLVGCTVSPGYEDQDFRWVRELPDHRQHFTHDMRGLEAFLQVGVSLEPDLGQPHRSKSWARAWIVRKRKRRSRRRRWKRSVRPSGPRRKPAAEDAG